MDAHPRRVRCRFRRIAATFVAVAATLGLAGCGGGAGSDGGFFSSRLLGGSTTLALNPIVGPPPNIADELTQSLVAAGKDRNLKIAPGGEGRYSLRGYVVASNERRGAKLSYIWDISDAKGQRVARVSGDEMIASRSGSDPWSGVDSAAIRSIATKTTSQISAQLSGGSPEPEAPAPAVAATPATPAPRAATARPAAPAEVVALVAPVSGAPGDGERSLTAAIKKRLSAGGVKLASSTGRGAYTVKGVVSIRDVGGGRERIRIDWQVIDPNGRRLGTVSQQNTIPKGSLNGPWGAVADAAAGAAADGIIKLLPGSRT